VAQEMARPEDVDSFVTRNDEVADKLVVLTRTLVETGTEEFKPADYKSSVRERYAEVFAAAANGTTPVATKKKAPVQSTSDLADLLEAAIAANVKGK